MSSTLAPAGGCHRGECGNGAGAFCLKIEGPWRFSNAGPISADSIGQSRAGIRKPSLSRRLRGSCRESAHPSIADVMLQHTVNGEKPAGALPIVRASRPCSKSSSMRMPFLPRCASEIFPVARRAACSILTRCGTRWIAQCLWRATSNVVKGPFYFEPYEADRPASSADRAPGRSNRGSRRSPHR